MLKLETHFGMSRNPLFALWVLATELHPVHLQPERRREIRNTYDIQVLTDSASVNLSECLM